MTTPPTVPPAALEGSGGPAGEAPAPRAPAQVDGAAGAPVAPTASAGRPVVPGAVVALVGCAAVFLILAGLYFTAWLVGPAFLALIIVIAIAPVQSWLLRHGWPSWLTTLVLVILVSALLLAFAVVIVVSIAQLAALLPQYADRSGE